MPAAQARPAAPAFQPHFAVKIVPPARPRPVQLTGDDREIVCGLVVIHKTPADDSKILLPGRDTGAAARRIPPQDCAGNSTPNAR